MNLQTEQLLPPRMADAVAQLASPSEAQTAAAQARLAARLESARRGARPARAGWLAGLATAAAALVLVVGLPMMSGGGDVFAAAQRHLGHFERLSLTVTQRQDGALLQTSRTVLDASGRSRTDVGDGLSIVVDPAAGRMLTVLHDTREALPVALPVTPMANADPVPWLAPLREFQGQAAPLPETRDIEGRTAYGWRADVQGQVMDLWIDSDGLPLALEMSAAGGIRIDYRFEFEPRLAPGHLSTEVPPGYAVVPPDDD
jgi:hypothetical protein